MSKATTDLPEAEVRHLVLETLQELAEVEGVPFEVSLTTTLFTDREDDGMGLDSLTALELLSMLEARLDIQLDDPAVVFRDTRCGEDIVRLVSGR